MNEFDYDVWQKKQISRGAYHMKRGSKSKKCSLPHDKLTPTQLRKLNGEVVNFSMNKPLSWGAFKKMSAQSQEEYLNGLKEEFGVSAAKIAKDMFDIAPTTLTKMIKDKNLNVCFDRRGSTSSRSMAKWGNFLSFDLGEETLRESEDNNEGRESVAYSSEDCCPSLEVEDVANEMVGLSLCWSGKISAQSVYNSLKYILGDDACGVLSVTFSRKGT